MSEGTGSTVAHLWLKEALDVRSLCDGKGAVIEVEDEEDVFRHTDVLYDENAFKCLSFGIGSEGNENNSGSESEDDKEPFEKMARNMVELTEDGGVLKMEVSPGMGPSIPDKARVVYQYSAYLEYSDEPFDTTYLRNVSQKTTLDSGYTIPGLNIALKSMRKKETSRFLIRPEYAYGDIGCPPRIPGNATILYEITLVNFLDCVAADAFEDLDEEDQIRATFEEKYNAAKAYHRKGNENYKVKKLLNARDCYRKAAWVMESAVINNDQEAEQQQLMIFKMHSNLAQVSLDVHEVRKACVHCRMALECTRAVPDDAKAKVMYRFGKAKMLLNDFEAARKYLFRAKKLLPNNEEVTSALETLFNMQQKAAEQERFLCRQMFQRYEPMGPSSDAVITAGGGEKGGKESNLTSKEGPPAALNVRKEFGEAVERQVLNFRNNPQLKELAFPSNLSRDEVACVAAAAKAAGCSIQVMHRGKSMFLKMVKS